MKLRVYLDTSVISVAVDERSPERRQLSQQFFQNAGSFEISVSELTIAEIRQTKDSQVQEVMLSLIARVPVLPVSEESSTLARHYREEGIFTPAMEQDSVHVAVAVLAHQDVILSWNFQHLVNRRRRGLINQLNLSLGLPMIEILAPPELVL